MEAKQAQFHVIRLDLDTRVMLAAIWLVACCVFVRAKVW